MSVFTLTVCDYFTDEIMNEKYMLEKRSSVIYGISVSPSLLNFLKALQTKHARQKKIICFLSLVIPSVRFNILPTGEPYVILSVS